MKRAVLSLCLLPFVCSAVAPWTVDSSVKEHVEQYSPPILANGDIGMLIDYRNCQFNDTKGLEILRSVAGEYFPTTCRQGRRTVNEKLVTFGQIEEEVVVDGAVRKPSSWRQKLDIFSAESQVENEYEAGARVDSAAFVAQTKPVIAVTKRFSGPVDRYVFKWIFRRPGLSGKHPLGVAYEIAPGRISWRVDRPEKKVSGGLAGKPKMMDPSFRGTIELVCSDPSAQLTCDADTLFVTLERPKGEVAFFVVFADTMDGKQRLKAADVLKTGYAALRTEHEKAWRAFWASGAVDLPDKNLERTYQTALYNLKCWSTKWTVPIGIQPSHWEGKFFGFGFNAAAFAGAGKFEEAKKIGRFWAKILPVAKSRCGSNVAGKDVDSGIRYSWETLENGAEGARIGRWLDHYVHLGTIAADCWNAYLYTGDREFLKTVYPVIRGCAQFFQSWVVQETRDGRTILGPVCDLERLPCPARNAFLTTCGAIYDFEKTIEAAEILGVDAEKIPEWRRLASELKRDLPRNETRYLAFEKYEDLSVGTLAGLFPYNVVPRTDSLQRTTIQNFEQHGIRVGNPYAIGERICTWYAAWLADDFARLLDGEAAYRNLCLANGSVGFFNEIYEINEAAYKSVPWCQAPQATFIQTVHDMLVQSEGDVIWICPAVPKTWTDFSACLRTADDITVDFKVVKGKIDYRLIRGPNSSTRPKTVQIGP